MGATILAALGVAAAIAIAAVLRTTRRTAAEVLHVQPAKGEYWRARVRYADGEEVDFLGEGAIWYTMPTWRRADSDEEVLLAVAWSKAHLEHRIRGDI